MSIVSDELVQARRLIRRANFFVSHENYDEAKKYYIEALQFSSQSVDILRILSKLEINENLESSIRYLRDALEIEDEEQIRIELANLLMVAENYEEAKDLVRDISDNQNAELINVICSIILNDNLQNLYIPNLLIGKKRKTIAPYLALLNHKLANHSKSIGELRKLEKSWQIEHALGIQNYIMGSLTLAESHLENAYKLYIEGNENLDPEIEEKLIIDKTIAIVEVGQRLEKLKDLTFKYNNWRIFQALFVTSYAEDKFTLSDHEIRQYLEKSIEYCTNEVIIDEMKEWRNLL